MISSSRFRILCILVFLLSVFGCASHPPERLYANENHLLGTVSDPNEDKWYKNDKSEGWFKEYEAAKNGGATASDIEQYLSMGMALTESLCFKQLDDIQRRQNNLGFSQGEFNLLVILGTGILGVNEASPENLTRTALGAAAINSTMDLYRDHYLLGPDGDVIVEMVKGGMRTLRQEIDSSVPPKTFVEAYGQLEAFSHTCTSSSIRKLVRDAIKSANIVATNTLRNTANDVHKDTIADALGRNGLSYEQMAAVYWYAMEQPSTQYDKYLLKVLNGITLPQITTATPVIRPAFRSMPQLVATYSSWVKEQKEAADVALTVAKAGGVLSLQDEKDEVEKAIVDPPRTSKSGIVFLTVE
ncbi:MAG: hypothetical protein CL693_00980 [Cellvibrionaceae bacterium]|nr:hypothetical protein [Cellvibrionaceae bacterium]|tara:strand:- start:10655 stop:11725 length:1071 start_codon:yes stop_codon:yes gene_type:complete